MITLYTMGTWNESRRAFRERETREIHEHLARDLHWTLHHPEGDCDEPCHQDGDRLWCPGPTIRDREFAKDLMMRGWRLTDVFADTAAVHGPIDDDGLTDAVTPIARPVHLVDTGGAS